MSAQTPTTLKDQLLAVANMFHRRTGRGPSAVAAAVLNNSKLFERLAGPKGDLSTSSWERMMQFYSDNWPDSAPWPRSVPRPPPTPLEKAG